MICWLTTFEKLSHAALGFSQSPSQIYFGEERKHKKRRKFQAFQRLFFLKSELIWCHISAKIKTSTFAKPYVPCLELKLINFIFLKEAKIVLFWVFVIKPKYFLLELLHFFLLIWLFRSTIELKRFCCG